MVDDQPQSNSPEPTQTDGQKIDSLEAEIRAELDREYTQVEVLIQNYRRQTEMDKSHLRRRLEAERAYRTQLEQIAGDLSSLNNTVGYKVLRRWWRLKSRVFPEGSRRNRAYRTIRTGTITLVKYGPIQFARAAILYAQGRRGYWQQVDRVAAKSARNNWDADRVTRDKAASFERIELVLHIDDIHSDPQIPHQVYVRGWALDKTRHDLADSGIDTVRFYLGNSVRGRLLGEVKPSLPRPDLRENISLQSNYQFAGYEILLKDLPSSEQAITACAYHFGSETDSAPVTAQVTVFGEKYDGDLDSLPLAEDAAYQAFMTRTEPDRDEIQRQHSESERWAVKPTFDFVTALTEDSPVYILELMRSVLRQSYPSWNWYVALPRTIEHPIELEGLASHDQRVHLIRCDQVTEDTLADAASRQGQGDYIISLEQDALLAPNALYEFACAIRDNDKLDLIYSDHDYLNKKRQRHSPLFKPDWSPRLLLSTPYAAYLTAIRRTLLAEHSYLESSHAALYGWDVLLRISRETKHVRHVAKVLYHRDAPIHPDGEADFQQNVSSLLSEHLHRLRLTEPAVTFDAQHPMHRKYPLVTWTVPHPPRISLIIPSRDTATVAPLLRGLFRQTTYPDYEVILVYNGGDVQQARAGFFAPYLKEPRFSLVEFDHTGRPFNFHQANHAGYAHASGDLILFMNDDTEVLDGAWLERMAQWFALDTVGAVGPKLLFPSGAIQHAGVIFGLHGLAGHPLLGEPENTWGLWGTDAWYRNLSVVTGGCLMVRRTAFEAVGGFDEGYLFHFGDVDFGLRLERAGYEVVYTPHVRLIHRESTTLRKFYRSDWELFARRWLSALNTSGDPYYNPNLSIMTDTPMFRAHPYQNPGIYLEERLSHLPPGEMFAL